jgi:predicted glycogen debranching enzyme
MREWLITNGLGGYASLPLSNIPTRKFHGLLVASLEPPTKRWVYVSHILEHLSLHDTTYNITQNGTFTYQLLPSFTYAHDDIRITKTMCMPHQQNTTILRYDIHTNTPCTLHITPIVNSRHFYDLTSDNRVIFNQQKLENGALIQPNNTDKTLSLRMDDSTYTQKDTWVELQYPQDKERNDSWIDHGYLCGEFTKQIDTSCSLYFCMDIDAFSHELPASLMQKEIIRRNMLLKTGGLPHDFDKLVLSTDNFVVKTTTSQSLIAGYHWFGVWGRDTMIALPGIALVTQRYDLAREILLSVKPYCKQGLIPNTVTDKDSVAVYNTVDASLWYIDRVFQYLKYTKDFSFLQDIWPTLTSIVQGYQEGTLFDIKMDDDYLIRHGPGLTWMDVKLDQYYPTPRTNKAVEIQALWYNALTIMSLLAHITDNTDHYADLANEVKKSFNHYYNQQYDVLDPPDLSCRPNKIFLVSLDFTMINKDMQKGILDDIRDNLLTPFGLRTLAPHDSRYLGTYLGMHNRDIAYHNGTVWPWLLGPYIKGFIKLKNQMPVWRDFAYKTFLKPMLEIYGDQWDGAIHEIFDGDSPYKPQGCISQAWSVAEILRAWVEDIEGISPKYENFFLLHEVSV